MNTCLHNIIESMILGGPLKVTRCKKEKNIRQTMDILEDSIMT